MPGFPLASLVLSVAGKTGAVTLVVADISGLGTLATQSGTFSGTSSGTNTGDQTSVSGNAGTATALQTARNINGVSFNGTTNITVTAAGSTLSDTVPVAKGGTGAITLAAHGLLVGNGTSAIAVTGTGSAGHVLTSNGASADPTFRTTSRVLFDRIGSVDSVNTDNTEDTLFSDEIPADTAAVAGDKIVESEWLVFTKGGGSNTQRIRKYFGSTLIYDSGAVVFSAGGAGGARIYLLTTLFYTGSDRWNGTVTAFVEAPDAIPLIAYTEAATESPSSGIILSTTGTVNGGSEPISAKLATISFVPAA